MPGRQSASAASGCDLSNEASEASEASAFLLCRKLRSKLAFSAVESSDGEHVSAIGALAGTAVYWCVSTMECAGPDGGLAEVSLCRADRPCYQPKG
jgi:hypothetical protein